MTKLRADVSHVRRLILAFAFVGLAFIGSSIFAQYSALDIDVQVDALVKNALPSITQIAAARTALRHLEVSADAYAEGAEAQRPQMRENVNRARRQLTHDLMEYLRMPEFVGERAMYEKVPPDLDKLDDAIEDLVAAVEREDIPRARHVADMDIRGTIERIDANLRALEEFNGEHAGSGAERILAIRRRSMSTAFILDGVCGALAIVAAFVAVRTVRKYNALAEAHSELQAQRADELEQFAKRVAHDLLSPLSALSFCLAFLKKHMPKKDEVDDAFVRANGCVKRSQNMVHAIFEFSRSGAKPEPGARAPLRDVVDDVVDELAPEPGVSIDVSQVASLDVACDPGVLSSILVNIMGNAVKYTKDSALREIRVRARAEGRVAHVEVEDSGPGLPPGMEGSVFDPYVRAPGVTQPGLGLGLATVKRLVDAHGGAVGARSASSGGGALFWFELPLAAPAHEERALAIH